MGRYYIAKAGANSGGLGHENKNSELSARAGILLRTEVIHVKYPN